MKETTNNTSEDHIPQGYLRVTQVLSPYQTFEGIPPDVLARAADRGSRVHKYCEAYVQDLFIGEVDADCKNYFDSFCHWFDTTVDQVVCTERRFHSEKYRVSGQVDLILKIKGDDHLSIVDIKTPANPASTWQLQTAAYMMLCQENGMEGIKRRTTLMLPKEGGKATLTEYGLHEQDIDLFIAAIKLYRMMNK